MPVLDIRITIPSTQCCFAIYDGGLTGVGQVELVLPDNGTTQVETQAQGTWRYWSFTTNAPVTMGFQWDTPSGVLLMFAQCNDGLSTVSVNGGSVVNFPVGACGFNPARTRTEPNIKVETKPA